MLTLEAGDAINTSAVLTKNLRERGFDESGATNYYDLYVLRGLHPTVVTARQRPLTLMTS